MVSKTSEIDLEPVREWLRIQVFDEMLIDILLDEDNLDSTLNIYKKREEGWKKKL